MQQCLLSVNAIHDGMIGFREWTDIGNIHTSVNYCQNGANTSLCIYKLCFPLTRWGSWQLSCRNT